MSALLHIAIDAMSGDRGPSICVPAALAAAQEHTDVRFTLIGRQVDLEREMAAFGTTGRPADVRSAAAGAASAVTASDSVHAAGSGGLLNVSCLFAAEVVEMTDHPREALRRKKNSSMRRALDLVKAHDANACVSAGNPAR